MTGHNKASTSLFRKSIGGTLRMARESKGLMLREIAAKAGIDPSHLGKFERDQRVPPLDLVEVLAKAYGVASNDLKRRILAKKLWDQCGGDPALAVETATQLQEDAAAYGHRRGRR